MDHLITPSDLKHSVSYIPTEDYDGGDFLIYPARLEPKWTADDLSGKNSFGARSSQDVEAFFQTWLYFGCLMSVFGTVSIAVTTADFVKKTRDGQQLLTTERLEGFMQEWMNAEGMHESDKAHLAPKHDNQDIDQQAKKLRGKTIISILKTVLEYVDLFCNSEGQRKAKDLGTEPAFWPISSPLAMCIMAMGESMQCIASKIYGFSTSHWGSSPFLNDLLIQSGWCPSDLPLFGERGTIDSHYYCAGYDTPRKHLDHLRCTDVACVATNVEHGTYVSRHATPDCECDFVKFDVEAKGGVVDIIESGEIPIVAYRDGKISVSAWKEGSNTQFVCISHVWSDGMGNEKNNELYECQLKRIQGMVDQLNSEPHDDYSYSKPSTTSDSSSDLSTDEESTIITPDLKQHIGFWMDTLCVPVRKELKPIRNKTITMMQHIYNSAQRVLVIDSLILGTSRHADRNEKWTRMWASNWHRRLWTLQEGLMAKSLAFQFKDGAQTMKDTHKDDDPDQSSPRMLYSSISGCCGGEFDPFYSHLVVFGNSDVVNTFFTMAHYIRSRTTSHARDEPICFATILGLPVDRILAVEGPGLAPRMKVFYELIGTFNSSIIFNDFPRLSIKGFRWAPASFLGHLRTIFATSPTSKGQDKEGLLQDGGGLNVAYPGAELEILPSLIHDDLLGHKFTFLPKDEPKGPCYGVYIQADENGSYPSLSGGSDKTYMLILFESLRKHKSSKKSSSVPTHTEAVLGILKRRTKTGRIILQHVARAQMKTRPMNSLPRTTSSGAKEDSNSKLESVDEMHFVSGKWLSSNQKWRII